MDLILNRLVEHVRQAHDADGAMVFTRLPESGALGVAACGMLAGLEGTRELRAGSQLLECLGTGAQVCARNPDEIPAVTRAEAQRLGIRAVLHVPLHADDQSTIGVLTLVARHDGLPDRCTAATLQPLTRTIALVLERQTEADRSDLRRQAGIVESERRFRAFMSAMPAVSWIKDQAGRFTFNHEFVRQWHVTPDDLIGKTDFDFLPHDVASAVRDNDALVAREQRTIRVEEHVPTPDGAEHIWLSTKFPIVSHSGEVHIGGIAIEITEQKRAEMAARDSELALRRSEGALRVLLESLAEGVVINRGGRFLYANTQAAKLFGAKDGAEMAGHLLFDLIDPVDHERLRSDMGRVEQGETLIAIRNARRLDGTRFLLEAHASRIEYQDGPALAVLMHDVTEARRRDAQLQTTSRLASVGTLAAAVAHEINNPLTFVISNLETIVDELAGLAAAPERALELAAMATDAHAGADRIRQIVLAMRTLARDSAAPRAPIALGGSIHAAIQLTANEIRQRATLVTDLRPTPLIAADETRLTQVLVNLLTNAAHALDDGTDRTHVVRIAAYTGATGHAVLEVADDGSGISPDVLPRIFDPFFTTKKVGVGTGLGLAITHTIVSSFGGEITVESTLGKGSLFRVTIPPATAPAKAEALPAAAESPPRRDGVRGRVLVVDDEPAIGRILARALRAMSHEPVVAASGPEALAILESGEIDVVLSDVMMPGMDGPALYREIARRFPEMVPNVVFMSGGAFTPAAEAILSQGSATVLAKPLDMKLVASVLDTALRQRPRRG